MVQQHLYLDVIAMLWYNTQTHRHDGNAIVQQYRYFYTMAMLWPYNNADTLTVAMLWYNDTYTITRLLWYILQQRRYLDSGNAMVQWQIPLRDCYGTYYNNADTLTVAMLWYNGRYHYAIAMVHTTTTQIPWRDGNAVVQQMPWRDSNAMVQL